MPPLHRCVDWRHWMCSPRSSDCHGLLISRVMAIFQYGGRLLIALARLFLNHAPCRWECYIKKATSSSSSSSSAASSHGTRSHQRRRERSLQALSRGRVVQSCQEGRCQVARADAKGVIRPRGGSGQGGQAKGLTSSTCRLGPAGQAYTTGNLIFDA